MIIFILIFFAMVIAVGASAVIGFSIYLKRKTKSLDAKNQRQFADAPPYRSLFEPDAEEIRAREAEELRRASGERREAERKAAFEKIEQAREFQKIWLENPSAQNAAELLRRAARADNAKFFSETAQSVIKMWRENKIKNLPARDLADLLDSHLAVLSQQERASGAAFLVKQETERLRRAA